MNTFIDDLRDLRNWVGQRNGRLLAVAIKGLAEGLTPDDVATAFATEDTGSPPLTEAEVARAISRAKERLTGDAHTAGARFAAAMRRMKKMQEATSPEERGFVRRMIAIGGRELPEMPPEGCREIMAMSARRLMDSSPVKVRAHCANGDAARCDPQFRRDMAHAFLRTVFPDDSRFVFSTWNIRRPREKRFTRHPSELAAHLDELTPYKNYFRHFQPVCYYGDEDEIDPCPTHIGVNYYTGEATKTAKGAESYANKDTVATFGHLLVEFDTLTLDEQLRFWNGVVMSKALPVLSLVFTGNKSIHGLIRVREHSSGDDLFGETTREAKLQMWERQVRETWRLCCSDDDPRFRCDAACKDCSRMTRFPGGWYGQTCTPQLLLWCNTPEG